MRDLAILATLVPLWAITLPRPFIGLLVWLWLSLMVPHQLAWGFISDAPVVMITAGLTIAAWLLKPSERKLGGEPVTLLIVVFALWTSITTWLALDPAFSAPYWERSMKTLLLAFCAIMMLDGRVRVQAFIWLIAVSIGYYAVKGGMWSAMTGGSYVLTGPPNSPIHDRNNLGLAILVILPLIYYLFQTTEKFALRVGLMGALVLAFIAVVGTHSRGALLGLVATGGLLWWRSERKLPSAAILGVGVCVALLAMPPAWFDRMESIGSALEDRSFQGRLLAWEFAVNVANDRLTGGGIKATEIPRFFQFYSPEAADFGKPLAAAHSIYFQVLGDHGYIGLVLYLTLLGAAALNLQWVRTRTRGVPELRWAFQLASALQVSLLAYLVTGAALSMAYTDLLMALLALTVAVKRVARRQLTASEPAVSPARLSRAKPASDVYVTSEMARKLGRPS